MLRLLFAFILVGFMALSANGQSYTVKGTIVDTLNMKSLQYGSVTLVHLPDSSISTFTRTNSEGSFVLHPDTTGKFMVIISFPGFADFVDQLNVKDESEVNLGKIPMLSRRQLMNEFVLRQRMGMIKIKGDTTEYVADSFKVHDNATVEDLLKKLPGIQVDKNGGIVAQGEKVQKVLVDGEEFFSDDPAVVTQNLDAKAVESVQVYDKKSDDALFTGIDDGEKEKTINLKLKEDRKKGYFGKVQAGAGTDGYYEGQGMINAFKGKRQLSAFAIGANTGKMGLGWEDKRKYSNSNANRQYDEESGSMYYFSNGDDEGMSWDGTYNGEGIPTALTGGVHYNNKYNEGKEEIGGNYRYAKQNITATGLTTTQYALADTVYNRRQNRETSSDGQRHAADGNFEWKIDSLSTLTATVDGGYSNTKSTSRYNTTTTRGVAEKLINESARVLINDASSQKVNANIAYRKKFKKKGRNMNLSLSENWNESNGTSYLLSGNTYYVDGGMNTDSVNQLKETDTRSLNLNGNINYTEPLSKTLFLTGSYGIGIQSNSSSRLSFDKQSGGEFNDEPNNTFSSNYDFAVLTHTGRASLRYIYKKYNLSLGSAAFFTSFKQEDLLRDTSVNRHYTNFAPSASFAYSFSKQNRLSFNYSGSTSQPTIDQLQPLQQNTDPLNISIGNPLLKQQFRNNFFLNWNNYKVLTGQHYYAYASFSFTNDAITQAQTIDDSGKRTYRYINTNGNYVAGLYASSGRKLPIYDIRANLSLDVDFRKSLGYINAQENVSYNNNYTVSLSFSKDWEKKEKTVASLSLQPSFTYNDNRATISQYTTSYWTASVEIQGFVELPWKLRLNSSLDISLRERTEIFTTNNNVFLWNAYCARKLGKDNKSELRLAVFDILNQNIGFSRNASDNNITQNSYNTIRRYGLLTFVWNFAKKPAGMKSDDDEE